MFDERKKVKKKKEKKEKEKKEGEKKWRIRGIDYNVWRQRQGCEHRALDYRCSVFWADFIATGKWLRSVYSVF